MATKPLQSITFPGIDNVYTVPQVDGTLTQTGAAADAKKTGDEISGLKNDFTQLEDKVEDAYNAYVVETETGSIASFTDGADDVPVKDLSVAIEPVQDLHGYDNPWSGGGNKNLLLPFKVARSNTIAGVSYSYDPSTEKMTISGTNTNPSSHYIAVSDGNDLTVPNFVAGDKYVFSVMLPVNMYCQFTYYDENNGLHSLGYTNGTGSLTHTSITIPNDFATIVDFQVYVAGQATSLSGQAYFSLVSGTTSPTSWTPYSNICPISGWTGANVTACGVNVWDEEWEVGGIDWSTGNNNNSETDRIRSKGYIPVKPNTSYCFSVNSSKYIWMYDESKTLITNISGNNNFLQLDGGGQLFTTKSNCYYVRFIMWITYGTTYNHDISINYPATDTDYHAYNGSSVSINWQSEAGTVYGGTLDVTTGVLTVDRTVITMDGTQSIGNNGTLSYGGIQVVTTPSPDKKLGATNAEGLLSDKFKIADIAEPYTLVGRTSNANLVFNMPTDVTSIELAKTWFTNNPTQVSYLLATPQTFQLTAQEVSTILGQNNIFADCGNVTAQYRADTKLYIDKVLNA